jgi:hypothetical protein
MPKAKKTVQNEFILVDAVIKKITPITVKVISIIMLIIPKTIEPQLVFFELVTTMLIL